jgi:hypothetical protein
MARKYKNYKSFNSSYIGGWTFEDGDKVLTIKDVQPMMVRNEKNQSGEEKMCILFEETDKPMVLNSTNNDTITKVLGSSLFDNWIGKQILIGTEKVRAFGDIWDAVRVRPELPKPKTTDPITPEQIDAINGLIETGAITNANMMLKYYKVSRLEEMSRAEAEQLIKQKSAGI